MIQENLFEHAEKKMNARFRLGEMEEAALIEQVAKNVIVDKLVPPRMMVFHPAHKCSARLEVSYNAERIYSIHRHAFGQLCSKVSFPMSYANSLLSSEDWRLDLLAHNLNRLFHEPDWSDRSGPVRFLHRIVGDELRGFLSRRYARHMASAPLLRAFIDAYRHQGARAIGATTSDVRLQLQCLLPKVFEAFPGENVCVGAAFSNSDFGAGRLAVKSTIWRVSSGASAVLDETFSKVHVGSIIDESELELSASTAQKEVAAQCGLITDVVEQLLSEGVVDRLLQLLRVAHETQIPWSKLKGRLSSVLSKGDLVWLQEAADHGSGIVDLPPVSYTPDGQRTPNAYWAAAALSAIAARSEDADKRLDLQQEAGKLLACA